MDPLLQQWLRSVRKRLQSQRQWRWLTLLGVVIALLSIAAMGAAQQERILGPVAGWALATILLLGVVLAVAVALLSYRKPLDVARRVEQCFPGLNQRLLSALAPQAATADDRVGYLQSQLLREMRRHATIYDWRTIVPTWRLWSTRCLGVIALLTAGWLILQLTQMPLPSVATQAVVSQVPTPPALVHLEPGDTEIERGSHLVVIAHFGDTVPPQATLIVHPPNAEPVLVPMVRLLDDPVWTATANSIRDDVAYRVRFGKQQSEEYQVRVFDFPDLARADAVVRYPEYTGLGEQPFPDTRRVTAVEGSQVSWTLHVNKPLESAVLESDDGDSVALTVDPADPLLYHQTVTLQEDRHWKVHLQDSAGRSNPTEYALQLTAIPNRPAELKLLAARDMRVSPLEELLLAASVEDDFGVHRYGITYTRPGQPMQEHLLGRDAPASEPQSLKHVLDFENLEAQPDDLVAYYFWAEDFDAQGQPRRSFSDQFFAEVRHFDEIFRQGQAPADTSSSSSQQSPSEGEEAAERLVELQRQIIAATWNLIRQETSPAPLESLSEDATVLLEAQQDALQALEEFRPSTDDTASDADVAQVRESMQQATQHLSDATAPDREPLQPALAAEQASYQGLLKLQAREFEVARTRQNSSSTSRSASSQQRQQQLQQLQLDNEQNRYETERQAQAPQSEREQEMTRTLSRLRDLARRQEDLNEQLQQQIALQEQTPEEERDELQRQLKRLREQQEQLLRDADELRQDLAQSENQREMQSTRQQLDESRQRMQQSTQALSEGQVQQSLSQGTRAERQLRQTGEQLRERTSERFADDLRQMRGQAQELESGQQQLSRQMANAQSRSGPGLRASTPDPSISEQLEQQQDRLESLLQQMQTTIQAAETAEPLLAEELYEGFRDAEQQRLPETLEETQELWETGQQEDALDRDEMVTSGVEQLRRRVDQAAENRLGSETEALRRAADELQQLAEQLAEEWRQAAASEADPTAERDPDRTAASRSEQDAAQTSQDAEPNAPGSPREGSRQQDLAPGRWLESFSESLGSGPITGGQYREWSERLRDVESLVGDPELREEAARIRDRARNLRNDLKRHSQPPQWSLVRELVAEPLDELRDRVIEELLRQSAPRDALVPVDRDPVPEVFVDRVRRYYEELGRAP